LNSIDGSEEFNDKLKEASSTKIELNHLRKVPEIM
jgi:hypothetical protein